MIDIIFTSGLLQSTTVSFDIVAAVGATILTGGSLIVFIVKWLTGFVDKQQTLNREMIEKQQALITGHIQETNAALRELRDAISHHSDSTVKQLETITKLAETTAKLAQSVDDIVEHVHRSS